jgi:type VI secretion system protein ImpC
MIGTISDIRTKTKEDTQTERSSEQPFRIALFGDFSGRGSRGEAPRGSRLRGLTPLLIDSDNFEEVMKRLDVRLQLARGTESLMFEFQELEDFHPDKLFQTEVFQDFRRSVEESWAAAARAESKPPAGAEPKPSGIPAPGLLDQVVEQTQGPALTPETLGREQAFEELIRGIVNPHLVPNPDPEELRKKADVDKATAELMRAVLGHPRFQALESAWRSVFFLLRRLETGSDLRIEIIDITPQELVADTLASGDLSASGLYRMLVEEAVGTPGQAPWSVLVPLEPFAPREQDLRALEQLVGIARIAGAPVLAAADPAFAGCISVAKTPDPDDWKEPLDHSVRRLWDELRRHSAAGWIGLAMPRFLLRLPYGPETLSVESFPFEEMPEPPVHDAYLWGSPAVACACLLGCAYNRHGWNFRPGKTSKLEGIPVHTYRVADLAVMTPAAEVWLTESAAERILDLGIMPLASVKNSDSIQLIRFQSIAMPPRPLAGPWD